MASVKITGLSEDALDALARGEPLKIEVKLTGTIDRELARSVLRRGVEVVIP